MASIRKRPGGQYRARYRDPAGKEHARHFARKVDAQRWLDEVSASVVTGSYTDPKTARTTVEQWCERHGWPGTRPGGRPRSGKRACTSGRSFPSSGPCRYRRCDPRTSGRGRRG
jgi:hypothetical protein